MSHARYYIAPLAAFGTITCAQHRAVMLPGQNGLALGWVRWYDPAARAAFEARANVHCACSAAHPISSNAASVLSAWGVTTADTVASAAEKIGEALGVIDVQF